MKTGSFWASLAVAALAVQMSGRILTPNGDGINDSVAFTLPSSMTVLPRALVYDMRGRQVADLALVSPFQLRWNGRDSTGRIVESGMYLVQITGNDEQWNGVVAVAK